MQCAQRNVVAHGLGVRWMQTTFQCVLEGIIHVKIDIICTKHHGIVRADWMDVRFVHGLCTKVGLVILQTRLTYYLYLSP